MLHVVTYATHSQGMFEKLINNPFGTNVTVLGWGKPWKGFSDKIKGVREHLDTLDDNDLLVFMDGWDSYINKDPSHTEELFNNMDCDILVSKDYNPNKQIFGTCLNNITANSGMYMGKVKSLKVLLDNMLSLSCNDDQVKLNTMCKKTDRLKIDEDCIIFQNTSSKDSNPKGIYVSLPGTTKGRWKRLFKEYSQFYVNTFIFLILLLILLFPKIKNILYTIGFSILFLYYIYSDKSCSY